MEIKLSNKVTNLKESATLALQEKVIEYKVKGIDIIPFTVGEPDFDTPKNIKNEAKNALDNGYTKYTPVSGITELKNAIKEKFKNFNHINYDTDQIVVSNGGKQCLNNALQSIVNPGDEVLIIAPYFLSYPEIIKIAGGIPIVIETDIKENYKLNIDNLYKYITNKTKAIIINSPSNPSGIVYTKEELFQIGNICLENNIVIISDEVYEYLIYDDNKHYSIASLDEKFYNITITISSLSKPYAMTGWRLGYLGAPKNVAKAITKLQSQYTSSVCSFVQKAAVEAISNTDDMIVELKDIFEKRRNLIMNLIVNFPYIRYFKPDGAFYILLDFKNIYGSFYKNKSINSILDISNILLEDFHVATIPCIDFGCKDSLRISYATSTKNIIKGINYIADFLKEIKWEQTN